MKDIRAHPRPTEILDQETGEIVLYPSMYKAAKALNRSSRIIAMYNGKVYKQRYKIKVVESSSDEESACFTCGEESSSSSEEKDLINVEESTG